MGRIVELKSENQVVELKSQVQEVKQLNSM